MRLFDADTLIKNLDDAIQDAKSKGEICDYWEDDRSNLLYYLDTAPTVDAVEVVHGHWIVLQNRAVESICYWSEEQKKGDKKGAGTMAKCKCSNCNWRTSFMGHVKTGIENMFNYCPNCGAKMDEVMSDD